MIHPLEQLRDEALREIENTLGEKELDGVRIDSGEHRLPACIRSAASRSRRGASL